MYDFVATSYDLAYKYRTPVLILSDGVIGQMMEKVEVSDHIPRWTDEELKKNCPWATVGKPKSRERNIITSLDLVAERMEQHNIDLCAKFDKIRENEVRFEKINCEDADYLFVAYGSSARIAQKAIQLCAEKGIKVGLLRPITLFPFPSKEINEMASKVKGILSVEMSAGQMVEDVLLAVKGKVEVKHYGRMGGIIHSPQEVAEALEKNFIGE
jgi:2-oxoglutarate ferredoxin oxidoreductase subunit alpha